MKQKNKIQELIKDGFRQTATFFGGMSIDGRIMKSYIEMQKIGEEETITIKVFADGTTKEN